MSISWLLRLLAYLSFVFLCPLFGVWLKNEPLEQYLEFPPIPTPKQPLPFSWPALLAIAVFVVICIFPFIARIIHYKPKPSQLIEVSRAGSFPMWGWVGVTFLLIFWVIAWTRFSFFTSIQRFTFAPLWFGYILTINALTFQRSSHCCLMDQPTFFVLLFPLSAIFWWTFEYINRFVANWYYLGVDELGPCEYFFQCTLAFSTVLPAVLSTSEWLSLFPGLSAGLNQFPALTINNPRQLSWILIGISVTSLISLAIWSDYLFFLVWIIPITLISGLHLLVEYPPLLSEIVKGHWRRIWLLALAGLICGFFWEMWNVNSLAHWKYNVPFVQSFMLFEMPLIGYVGYFPFGIICGLFVDFIMSARK